MISFVYWNFKGKIIFLQVKNPPKFLGERKKSTRSETAYVIREERIGQCKSINQSFPNYYVFSSASNNFFYLFMGRKRYCRLYISHCIVMSLPPWYIIHCPSKLILFINRFTPFFQVAKLLDVLKWYPKFSFLCSKTLDTVSN